MSGILKIIDLNVECERNLEANSDFVCGSGQVILKHDLINTWEIGVTFP